MISPGRTGGEVSVAPTAGLGRTGWKALLPGLVPALLALAAHLFALHRYGTFRDEFYYVACGRHLAWGYVDHPPMIAAIAALVRTTLGDSLLALRVLPALAHVGLVLVTARIARRLGGDARAELLAATAAAIAPVYLGSATILNMNPFDQLLWALASLLLVAILQGAGTRAWVMLGLVVGLDLLTKHSTAFFLGATAVALVMRPERRLIRTRGPWIAAAIALVMVAPNLLWEVAHRWPTLEFLRNAAERKNFAASPFQFLSAQALLIHPLAAPLALIGLGTLLFAKSMERVRALGLAFLLVLAFFTFTHAKHYYLAPAYPVVLAAGAVAISRFAERQRWRALVPVYAALLIVTGALLAPFAIPVLPLERFVAVAKRSGFVEPPSERHRPARLPQMYADMFGWPEMTAAVARVWNALPAEDRAHCAIFASNYGEAGAIDFFGPKLGLPHAYSGHNSYWWWGPPPDSLTTVITIGESREDVLEAFEEVETVDVFHHEWNMPYESDLPILIGKYPRAPWSKIWPQTRKYI